jgi:hypothetical protein
MRCVLLAAILGLLFTAGGCDASFEAFEETDLTYSVFGYLDANADRQFVRVEPVQDSAFAGSGGDVEARVTSTNLATGETVVWQDSTFRLGANDVPVHNFTTTADLEPGATYRFRVEREGGEAASTAEVTLPPAFPPFELLNAPGSLESPPTLRVEGIERLGGVRIDVDYELCFPRSCNRRQDATFHLNDTTRTGPASWGLTLDWQRQLLQRFAGEASIGAVYDFRVTVAAASEDWPDYADDNPLGGGPEGQPLPPPRVGTNVEGGTGFLGGAFTRTVDVPVQP